MEKAMKCWAEFRDYHLSLNKGLSVTYIKYLYKKEEEKMIKLSPDCVNYNMNNAISLEPLCDVPCAPPVKAQALKKKKEENMNTFDINVESAAPTPTDQLQRDYLKTRLNSMQWGKQAELSQTFYMNNDDPPVSLQELLDRIAAGRYTVDKEKLNKRTYDPLYYVTWRDPAHPKDEAGYNKATRTMDEARIKTTDVIMIQSPADGLAALNAFEAQTFH